MRKRNYAPCPGIGWERPEPRRSALIGGRSQPRRAGADGGGPEEPDDDVIVRGRD